MASSGAVSSSARPTIVEPVSLAAVSARLGVEPAGADVALTGVSLNSATVRAGDLYAALPGSRTHGANYAAAAIQAGAVAVLTDPAGAPTVPAGVPVLVVEQPRSVLGAVAAQVYGEPAADLTLVGVTGTQGKTTTTQLIRAAAARGGRRTAVVGTMGTWIGDEPVGSALTTPEAPDLHALFAVMRERGVELCAMEVSSHAIVMGRVDAVVFDLAVFTNLGRDHLDFHADMEDYFAAKAQLFTPERARQALVNVDDEHGRRLIAAQTVPTQTFSGTGREADWSAEIVLAESTPNASVFDLAGPGGVHRRATVGMPGAFNVANAAGALAACAAVGIDLDSAIEGIASLGAVAGRMERVTAGQPYAVIVDYAHKPDAVQAVLDALRPVTTGRLIVVIGAGGDRDQGKRPIMGEIAGRLADLVVVTDDNPRTEVPAAIRAELVAGARRAGAADVVEVGDRREAIEHAVRVARAGDTVLIAGKGHETGQEVDGLTLPFDDRLVALDAIRSAAEEARP